MCLRMGYVLLLHHQLVCCNCGTCLTAQGCAWGEYMDGTMIEGRVWPRMSAIAERLWARQDVTDPNAALPRLVDHRCRMILRGMGVEPLQPDYCDGSRR